MELKASSPKQSSLSPLDCVSDHEEKELSDEDDDDRNHKHRRRETRSQSLERDALDQVYTRPYRKYNKPLENGHPFRENESQASESWRNYNVSPLEKDLTAKFERRRPGLPSLTRTSLDLNQRIRTNQTFYGDPGPGRGRGRDSGSWNQRDSRLSSVDIASQMVQSASMAPSLFAGRGVPSVSNAQSESWSAFGLISGPGVPNGGLDTLHPYGLQSTFIPPLSSSVSMGITHQRCRDFEERGFCLRGDMCPMEHGVNRIVVEDVQSLSRFNLTIPLPSAPLLATPTPAGPGALSSVGAPSTTLMSSKGVHSKGNKPGVTDNEGLNGAYSGSAAGGADLYDPDQPLWNNNGLETSSLAALHSSNDETKSLLNNDSSNHYRVKASDNAENGLPMRNAGTTIVSQNTSQSVWGRIGGLNNRENLQEKVNEISSSSDFLENETKEDKETLPSLQSISHGGKRITEGDASQKAMDVSSTKIQSESMLNIRRPSQTAVRTLFVNSIPQKINRREALLSHFRKFGEIVDIYIPLNSERAFVQFSKREEAKAALKSPDAVMGNRFIKLWWANRDRIIDDGISSGSKMSETSHVLTTAFVPAHPSIANKMKDNNLQSAGLKGGNILTAADVSTSATYHPASVITNGPKVPPPVLKKDSLEQLKEELRKKQELLDQKRNDFRRKLDKLEKQAAGVKGEVVSEQAAKRLKVGIATDLTKATVRSSGPAASVASPSAEMMADKNKVAENIVSHSQKLNTAMVLQESTSFKQQIHPLAPGGPPVLMNSFKLDNRPTTFRIIPPLPAGFAFVPVLKEHFSSYGDLFTVELEDGEVHEDGNDSDTSKNCSARITFTTRGSAERAFLNGKCWQGHNLQFTWLMPSSSSNDLGNKEKSSSAGKGSSGADVPNKEKLSSIVAQEPAASGNTESENSERESSVEHVELQEVSQPGSPTPMSGEEKSPKDNVC